MVAGVADVEEHWPVLESRDIYRGDWVVALRADRVRRPGGEGDSFVRYVVEHPGAAVVLAVDDAGRVACLRQYRHAAGRRFVELPAGLLDQPGEAPLDVARRELAEEVGLAASSWTHLTSAYSSPGYSAEVQHLFLARGLTQAEEPGFVAEHEEADMERVWVPFDALLDGVLAGRIRDAPVALTVLLAHTQGLVGASTEEH